MKKVLILICLLITSCASSNKDNMLCPALSIVPDASFITKYEEGTKNKYYQANIENARGYCFKEDDKLIISGDFNLSAQLTEQSENKINLPLDYFITVLNENNEMLFKHNYVESLKFKNKQQENMVNVKFEEMLDDINYDNISNYNILLSFQLTKEELKENRDSMKLY